MLKKKTPTTFSNKEDKGFFNEMDKEVQKLTKSTMFDWARLFLFVLLLLMVSSFSMIVTIRFAFIIF